MGNAVHYYACSIGFARFVRSADGVCPNRPQCVWYLLRMATVQTHLLYLFTVQIYLLGSPTVRADLLELATVRTDLLRLRTVQSYGPHCAQCQQIHMHCKRFQQINSHCAQSQQMSLHCARSEQMPSALRPFSAKIPPCRICLLQRTNEPLQSAEPEESSPGSCGVQWKIREIGPSFLGYIIAVPSVARSEL